VYAQTKIDSERLLLEAESPNFCPTVLRLATLFGLSPRPRFDLVVNLLTARAIRLGKITIFNGEQWRPFMHVHDAARAFITALEGAPNIVAGEIFNAGSHRLNFRLSELAEKITQNIPTVDVERIDNDDKRDYKVSFDKIHSFLRFECERSLEDGIREIAEMLRTEEIGDFTSEMFNNHEMIKSCAETPLVGQSSIRLLEMLARPE
jgi:nucleoside-diphosphate-sugar epimerase